ncbi:ABC transporter ATP-binding protein [Hazenella sp. IB182357]|uniref:ABC transporter ATP-binding protein n=1 Tax=Polycladospora coralii TaxID=2771432 RepID=A0A926RSX6_9BACL|nr:ABC transporter ATP-binding protein [Polycladospora coralii]MBD1372075.1 ABC transporter ATP-binding protein [Polycladospora coralii]MBS7530581.1 ABC transporter ATP-binding protein [Polycladospora coralii]
MIQVSNLSYCYPSETEPTLQGLNFTIEPGEIFGLLGPSGAGKSTTQNILIGLLKSYDGHVKVKQCEVKEWGQDYYEHIGVSFELPNHYLKLTAVENLKHFGSLYHDHILDPMMVLDWVGLADDAHKKVSDFSKGMKIRLNVARSLLHQPQVLFLDEPTSGLDPVNARRMKDLILKLRKQGTTILISTHNMSVADELCDRVAFITAGKIRMIDSPAALKRKFGKRSVRIGYTNEQGKHIEREFPLAHLGQNRDFLNILQADSMIDTIHTQETTLEHIFIQVTGQELVV